MPVYRLEATLGEPVELGDSAQGHRRTAPLTGGTFIGATINGKLLPGASADWQTVLPDGTALGDIRYTLQTDGGKVLSVQSRGVRHGRAEVLARLARGEDVDASEYTFRTSTQIETAVAELDWLNKGVFVSVGGRQAEWRGLGDLPCPMSAGCSTRPPPQRSGRCSTLEWRPAAGRPTGDVVVVVRAADETRGAYTQRCSSTAECRALAFSRGQFSRERRERSLMVDANGPGPGRSTSEAALGEIKREIARRN